MMVGFIDYEFVLLMFFLAILVWIGVNIKAYIKTVGIRNVIKLKSKSNPKDKITNFETKQAILNFLTGIKLSMTNGISDLKIESANIKSNTFPWHVKFFQILDLFKLAIFNLLIIILIIILAHNLFVVRPTIPEAALKYWRTI